MSAEEPEFLDFEDVLELHRMSIESHGGSEGVRDSGLLDSALAQPGLSFGGQYAHEGLFAMAAAYLFHIARNHPFIDGNKRTALLASLVFLDLNGITIERESEAMYELAMGVAEGRIDKAVAAVSLERAARAS